jgi:predicted nucleic acid-binding protein
LVQEDIELYAARDDKDWGMTDCSSFIVMRRRGIADALTPDIHFQQAGFRSLLVESD